MSDGIVYAVITKADGPFREGEIVVGGFVPGGHIREIGGMGRKPIKWDCLYELFVNVADAAERAAELTLGQSNSGWVVDAIEAERSLIASNSEADDGS